MSVPDNIKECTIDQVHRAYRCGKYTAADLTQGYLDRIDQSDRQGPSLNAFVTVNPSAVDQARYLDAQLARTGKFVGPLHGIPLVVKDCLETQDLPTSFGSCALRGYQPDADAATVAKLRRAGAVVLGKTALPDFAASWFTFSSLSGVTHNPYRLDCDPGGSSSGTAVAVADNLGRYDQELWMRDLILSAAYLPR